MPYAAGEPSCRHAPSTFKSPGRFVVRVPKVGWNPLFLGGKIGSSRRVIISRNKSVLKPSIAPKTMWVNELNMSHSMSASLRVPQEKALNAQLTHIKDKNPSNKTYQLQLPFHFLVFFSIFLWGGWTNAAA